MYRPFLLVACITLLAACNTQRMICPAYQSSFIYDKEATRARFSYFNEDSTPKVYTASKNQYLVAVPESYRKKFKKMQTVEMKPVYPPDLSDSLKQQDEYSMAEMEDVDSTQGAVDSVYAITKTKEKYNLDQDLYMWYFKDVLVLPDVRAALDKKDESGKQTSANKEKKGIKGFFQGLFKKKPKATDSTDVTQPPTSDVNAPPKPEKKKGGLFKKKSKEPDPAKKEGDGF